MNPTMTASFMQFLETKFPQMSGMDTAGKMDFMKGMGLFGEEQAPPGQGMAMDMAMSAREAPPMWSMPSLMSMSTQPQPQRQPMGLMDTPAHAKSHNPFQKRGLMG